MNTSARSAILVVVFSAMCLQFCHAGTCNQTTTVTLPDLGGIGNCIQAPFDKELYEEFVMKKGENGTALRDLVMNDKTNSVDLRYLTCSDGEKSDENLSKAVFSVVKVVSCLNLDRVLGPIGLITLSANLAGFLESVLANLLKS